MVSSLISTRRSPFWIGLTCFSLVAAVLSYRYFSVVFPLVDLDLTMDRAQALERSRLIAREQLIGPQEYREAASFDARKDVQYFVELEAGGAEKFREILKNKWYEPYQWQVRHFQEGEAYEALFYFDPQGNVYGFDEHVPEDMVRPNITAHEARSMGEEHAAAQWRINFADYDLIEDAQETRPNGRIDHTFTYRHKTHTLGEGEYRLVVRVAGNKVSEVHPFIKVPESFLRRYAQMRSFNASIATSALFIFFLLFLLGCGCIGLFMISRRRGIVWKQAAALGAIVGILFMLVSLNELPLAWMSYHTALGAQTFIMQRLITMFISGLKMGILCAFGIMAAENLSRAAFGSHPQIWRLGAQGVANTLPVVGRVISGYFLAPFGLLYSLAFYFLTTRYFGWWMPLSELVDPDTLATYVPALPPIATAFFAGCFEECTFRALPLATAALLGQRFGKRGWWMSAAFVLQAVVFAAAHATYAQQPAYARVIELTFFSFLEGAIYLLFGLVPGILMHVFYDLILMSLPVFVASSPGIMWQRALVIGAGLLPLIVVAVRACKARGLVLLDEQERNAGWVSPVTSAVHAGTQEQAPRTVIPVIAHWYAFVGIALVGAGAWWFKADHGRNDGGTLSLTTRSQALEHGAAVLRAQGIDLPAHWKALTSVQDMPGLADSFVWRTSGKQIYQQLVGTYLPGPHWRVRYAQFDHGDVVERTEEYAVYLNAQGDLIRFAHRLPESRPGKDLSREQARVIVDEVIPTLFKLNLTDLRELSAVSSKHPHRTDWKFEFEDVKNKLLAEGEQRLMIVVAGDEVADYGRYVHVPEPWERAEANRKTILSLIMVLCSLLLMFGMAWVIGRAILSWQRDLFSTRVFAIVCMVSFGASAGSFVLLFPALEATFSTARPYVTQILLTLAMSLVISGLVSAAFSGLVAGYLQTWRSRSAVGKTVQNWLAGVGLGIAVAGVYGILRALMPQMDPTWGSYSELNAYVPFLAMVVKCMMEGLPYLLFGLSFVGVLNCVTQQWTRYYVLGAFVALLTGIAVAGANQPESVALWLVPGAILGASLLTAYVMVLRHDFSLACAVVTGFAAVRWIVRVDKTGNVSLFLAVVAGILLMSVAGFRWMRTLNRAA